MELDEQSALGPRFVTVRQAARYLGSGETWVKERIRSGELESVKLGAGTRVVVSSLVALADRLARDARRSDA